MIAKHLDPASSSGASFFAYHGRGERETRVTGDEPQGTMGIEERRLGTRLI